MKIQLKSDLHYEKSFGKTRPLVEKNESYINPEADVVVLAGDITGNHPMHIDYLLHEYKDCKKPILMILGNHEYYEGDVFKTRTLFAESLKGTNITLLDPGWTVIDGVLFVGATLWTELKHPFASTLHKRWSDFEWIDGMTISIWRDRYREEKHFIQSTLSNDQFKDLPKVVITHHLPLELSVPERFKGTLDNMFFTSNCEDLVVEDWSPKLWLHGHTHDSCDYVAGNTRVVCNPYGYYNIMINKDFDKESLIEV